MHDYPEALSQKRQLVLLGGPGSGKSSFLRYLAVTLAQSNSAALPDGWGAAWLLPLFASLGAFVSWSQATGARINGGTLWRYLLFTAQEYGLEGLDQPLKRAFRHGGVLLLLDGLDEVIEPQLRVDVARAVAALSESASYMIVTCRVRSFEGAVTEPFVSWGSPVLVAPFNADQMHAFVQTWYKCSAENGMIDAVEAKQRATELINRIAMLDDLRDLGQTPLLLTIITILHYYDGKIPDDRSELYEDLVQLLLTRWTIQRREAGAQQTLIEQLKADKSLGGLKEYHLRNTLETLAYRAHLRSPLSNGRGLIDRDQVRGTFQRLFEEFDIGIGLAAEKTMYLLEYLEYESGLLLSEGGELYGLPHLTYEEYLTGCYLSRQPNLNILAYEHWLTNPTRWREPIFLALGHMVRNNGREAAASWLMFLLAATHGERERDASELQHAAYFAYECLDQMGGKAALIGAHTVALPELWKILVLRLAEAVEGITLPVAMRMQAGEWIGKIGDLD